MDDNRKLSSRQTAPSCWEEPTGCRSLGLGSKERGLSKRGRPPTGQGVWRGIMIFKLERLYFFINLDALSPLSERGDHPHITATPPQRAVYTHKLCFHNLQSPFISRHCGFSPHSTAESSKLSLLLKQWVPVLTARGQALKLFTTSPFLIVSCLAFHLTSSHGFSLIALASAHSHLLLSP